MTSILNDGVLQIIQQLNQGGSGTGISHYATAYTCGMKAKLYQQRDQEEEPNTRDNWHGKEKGLTYSNVGKVFHALADIYHRNDPIPQHWIAEHESGIQDAQEGERLFNEYTKRFKPDAWGKVLGTEVQIALSMGDVPLTGRLDLATEMSESDIAWWEDNWNFELDGPGLYVIDHKTQSFMGAQDATFYAERMQMWAYPLLAEHHYGKPCKGIIANTITGYRQNKKESDEDYKKRMDTVGFRQFFVPRIDAQQESVLSNILKDAQERKELGVKNLFSCVQDRHSCCPFYTDGTCIRY